MEEWRPYPKDARYEVSDLGNVRRLINRNQARNRHRRQFIPMTLQTTRCGHKSVSIAGVPRPVHRMVYLAFVGELVDGLVICHIDGNPANNAPGNLLQATQAENISHKLIHGTAQLGQKHGNATHTDAMAPFDPGSMPMIMRASTRFFCC
jgi:hypothetical protein